VWDFAKKAIIFWAWAYGDVWRHSNCEAAIGLEGEAIPPFMQLVVITVASAVDDWDGILTDREFGSDCSGQQNSTYGTGRGGFVM
jgi:hypothetical protein